MLPVLPLSSSNVQFQFIRRSLGEGRLVIGNIGTGNIFTLATFPRPDQSRMISSRSGYGAAPHLQKSSLWSLYSLWLPTSALSAPLRLCVKNPIPLSLHLRLDADGIGLYRLVLVIALVVGDLLGLGDYRDAGDADRVEAHALRLRAGRERRAAVREGDDAAADRAEQDGLHRRPQRLAKDFQLILIFIVSSFLLDCLIVCSFVG